MRIRAGTTGGGVAVGECGAELLGGAGQILTLVNRLLVGGCAMPSTTRIPDLADQATLG